ERKAHDDPTAAITLLLHPLRTVHPGSDVVGDGLVELCFERAETEPQRMRLTLREQALAVEGPKVLLDEAPHHVADIRHLAMPTAAGEPIRIDEGHEREE